MGEHGMNIANFTLGRSDAGGEAIALLYIDAPMSEAAIKALHATGKFRQIRPLQFDMS
jgi:D-3-phosphoglycerate dehydrogenase